jgi:hypothetical protein
MADSRLVFGGVTFPGFEIPDASCCRAALTPSTRTSSLRCGGARRRSRRARGGAGDGARPYRARDPRPVLQNARRETARALPVRPHFDSRASPRSRRLRLPLSCKRTLVRGGARNPYRRCQHYAGQGSKCAERGFLPLSSINMGKDACLETAMEEEITANRGMPCAADIIIIAASAILP